MHLVLRWYWKNWSFDLELYSLFWIVCAVILWKMKISAVNLGRGETGVAGLYFDYFLAFGSKINKMGQYWSKINKMDQFGEILFLRKFNSILKILWTVLWILDSSKNYGLFFWKLVKFQSILQLVFG